MRGVDICMSVKYSIEMPDNCSADFWKILTNEFNVVLISRKHTIDGETLCVEVKILDSKQQNI